MQSLLQERMLKEVFRGRRFRLIITDGRPDFIPGSIVRVVDVSPNGYLKVVLEGESTMTYIGGKEFYLKEVFDDG